MRCPLGISKPSRERNFSRACSLFPPRKFLALCLALCFLGFIYPYYRWAEYLVRLLYLYWANIVLMEKKGVKWWLLETVKFDLEAEWRWVCAFVSRSWHQRDSVLHGFVDSIRADILRLTEAAGTRSTLKISPKPPKRFNACLAQCDIIPLTLRKCWEILRKYYWKIYQVHFFFAWLVGMTQNSWTIIVFHRTFIIYQKKLFDTKFTLR